MTSIQLTTTTKNDINLKDFCELTRKAYHLKYFPVDAIIQSTNGWTKLADRWELLIDETDMDIFRDVAYLLKWGTPAESPTLEYQVLVDAVSTALLNEGPAREAWVNHEYCLSAVFETAREYNPWVSGGSVYSISYWHYKYTMCKMLIRVLNYRKGHVTKCKDFASHIRYYEERIIKLLPDAAHWPAEYWLNENNIIDELDKVCPYDYRNDISSYHALLHLASSPKRMPTDRDWHTAKYISNVKACSVPLVKAIWPNKTDDALIRLLLLAEKRAEDAFNNPEQNSFAALYDPMPEIDYTLLSKSWLFSYINMLQTDQQISPASSDRVKQALFNIITHS